MRTGVAPDLQMDCMVRSGMLALADEGGCRRGGYSGYAALGPQRCCRADSLPQLKICQACVLTPQCGSALSVRLLEACGCLCANGITICVYWSYTQIIDLSLYLVTHEESELRASKAKRLERCAQRRLTFALARVPPRDAHRTVSVFAGGNVFLPLDSGLPLTAWAPRAIDIDQLRAQPLEKLACCCSRPVQHANHPTRLQRAATMQQATSETELL